MLWELMGAFNHNAKIVAIEILRFLACGYEGCGRMPEPAELLKLLI
jgi:hypothetical protein